MHTQILGFQCDNLRKQDFVEQAAQKIFSSLLCETQKKEIILIFHKPEMRSS